jgi:DNA-binding transcriptional LysR family regulator
MFNVDIIKRCDDMRTLDLTALRSFATVAETGGVTRAAGILNLTQSAVSMQIKRLEESLNLTLLDRNGRGVALTGEGEQLLAYARRMLQLNDEALGRLQETCCEGTLTLGVPHDIVYQAMPQVMAAFARAFPRMRVQLVSSFTLRLKQAFANGEMDIILTTEESPDSGAELLARQQLVWVGAPGGQAWRQRPLRLAFEDDCFFRRGVQRRLEDVGIAWEMAADGHSSRAVEVTVSADLAVHAMLDGAEKRLFFEKIPHGGALPDLTSFAIGMYVSPRSPGPALDALAGLVRQTYRGLGLQREVEVPARTAVA